MLVARLTTASWPAIVRASLRGVEQADPHGGGAQTFHQAGLVVAAHDGGDRVAGAGEQGEQGEQTPPHHPGTAGDEDAHRTSSSSAALRPRPRVAVPMALDVLHVLDV